MGYLTPEEIPASFTRRWICVPDDQYIVAALNGAILELTYPENWELYGAITPIEMVEALLPIVFDFQNTEGLCMPLLSQPALLSDVKAQGTAGGTFTSGAWQTRVLNTLNDNGNLGVELASNQFTLPPGNWLIKWRCPGYVCNGHVSRLWNVTEGTVAGIGSSTRASSGDGTQTDSVGIQTQNNALETTYRIEHRCATTRATDGFGFPPNLAEEVYTQVEIYRMS